MSVNEEKIVLRERIRQLKKSVSYAQTQQSSFVIMEEIESLDVFSHAKIILMYWSMDHEVSTHDFIKKWSLKKKILLPVTAGEDLQLKEFQKEKLLQKSANFPVYEPVGEVFEKLEEVDLAIIPGVAFDNDGNRLGFGKGYFDRLLSKLSCYKIGICFDFQLLDNIPYNDEDIKMNKVISK